MLDDNEFEPACPCGCGATLESVAGHTDSSSNDEIEHDPYIETYNDEDDEYYEELDEDDFISGATSSCPWEFSIPSNLPQILQGDQRNSLRDCHRHRHRRDRKAVLGFT